MTEVIEVRIPPFSSVFGDEFSVFCGWGEGPDVGINLKRQRPCVADQNVYMDFSADQAEALGKALIGKAAEARQWDADLNAYFDYEERNPIRLWTSACFDNDPFNMEVFNENNHPSR